ncbi:MAG: UDP-4-amino-4,6-dideoxy-N-acetyl-beta-L-altrosamine transaminase [Clostridiaceae bacterium]
MEGKLAVHGGTPVRESYLPYGRQSIDDKDVQKVVEVLKGDFLTTGPYVSEFEKKVADYVGAKYAVAVCNGTAALHMACYAAGIQEGDEVIVSSMTFAASSNCVLYCKGTPVFADIDPNTYNIDLEDLQRKITSKTKAIVAVDFTGQPVDIDAIREIANKNDLIFIEDGAHSLGSEYKGVRVGSQADMTMFSFHPVKPVTTGEGGIITTNNEVFYKKMLLFRTHGITKNPSEMRDNHGPWYHEQIELGYNYRITDLQSVLGTSQMDKLDGFIKRRREIVSMYNEAFKELPEVVTPYQADFAKSGYHIYVLKLNLEAINATKKDIFTALLKENIGVNLHYLPVYLHPYYQDLGYKKGLCKVAEDTYERILTIPLFPAMSDQDIQDVINAVRKVITYYRKCD